MRNIWQSLFMIAGWWSGVGLAILLGFDASYETSYGATAGLLLAGFTFK